MRVDRSLVGVIGIAIVLSTLITLFIIGERAKEDVTILRNEFPTKLSAMEQKYAFVLSMIARKPLVDVTVKYNTLSRVLRENIGFINPNKTTGSTAFETIKNIAKIKGLMDEAARIGAKVDMWNGTVKWKNATRTHDMDMYMYDFTDVMRASMPNYTVLDTTTTYVVWLNHTNGSIFYYFQGVPDYYYARNRTIVDLTLTHNEDSKYYRAVSEIEVEGKYEQIMLAPLYGTVTFEDIKKDDRLFIIYSLKGTTVSNPYGILQVVRVYRNAELETLEANYMTP